MATQIVVHFSFVLFLKTFEKASIHLEVAIHSFSKTFEKVSIHLEVAIHSDDLHPSLYEPISTEQVSVRFLLEIFPFLQVIWMYDWPIEKLFVMVNSPYS